MKFPANPENFHVKHVERGVALVWRKFQRYNKIVDLENLAATDELYCSIQILDEEVAGIAMSLSVCVTLPLSGVIHNHSRRSACYVIGASKS